MKKLLFILLCFVALFFNACSERSSFTADQIIDKSIIAHGGNLLNKSIMDFTFRGVKFQAVRDNGAFEHSRTSVKDSLTIVDVLNNQESIRAINGVLQQLPDSLLNRYSSSVNSVIYFAQLPYSLDGPAVYKELIGEKKINNKDYYKLKITFDPNGGGEDHEDEFIYWIEKETFLVDYLAYSYCEEDCGYRFRESMNRRTVKGIIVQDYNNYKEAIQDPDLAKMDDLFIDGKLKLLSKIELEDVVVTLK